MIIVDKNGYQAMGTTDEIINQTNLHAQIESFGFEVKTIDGHDEEKIDSGIKGLFSSTTKKPKAIVANTLKGKGVSFMENSNEWHYSRLDQSTYEAALSELDLRK